MNIQSSVDLTEQITDNACLVELVQALEHEQLLQLIEYIGVEDAGDIISLATATQLTSIFDEVFWKNTRPGEREKFDPGQFSLWLDVVWEHSEKTAKQFIGDMDDNLLTLGLAENLLVIDYESFLLRMQNSSRSFEDDLLDKLLDSERIIEWEEMFIIPKSNGGVSWDTLMALLVELDCENSGRIRRILEFIKYISTEYIEDNGGLYNVLTSGEMLEGDLLAERETRRERQGYVSPESAAAFLKHAQTTSLEELITSPEYDYLTSCYFDAFSPDENRQKNRTRRSRERLLQYIADMFPETYRKLADAGVNISEKHIFKISGKQTPDTDIAAILHTLEKDDAESFNKCLSELHYLANVLMAGDSSDGKNLSPVEAAKKTMGVCQLGLQHVTGHAPTSTPETIKKRILGDGLIKLFRIGWNVSLNLTIKSQSKIRASP